MESDSQMPIWAVFFLLILIVINGIIYGFSAALQTISENEIEKKASEGNKKAVLLMEIIKNPFSCQQMFPVSVAAAGIYLGVFFAFCYDHVLKTYIQNGFVIFLCFLLLILLFAGLGLLAFRRVGTYQPERFAMRYVTLVNAIAMLIYPITMFVTFLAKLVSIPAGVSFDQKEENVTEEEIISIVDEAHEQGVIEENEAEMIQNIISFNETDASEIMTHRMHVIAFSKDEVLEDVVDAMIEEGRSRYPVYGEDLDDIVGLIHYKDVMEYVNRYPQKRRQKLRDTKELLREASFIPETRSIGDLFRTMQAKKIHLAVVVDEYGQTSGIISLEDILEEIVGEIQDEYDEDEVVIRALKDHSLIIHSLTALEDVGEELNIDFSEYDFETLNGYLTSLLGHIPAKSDLGQEIVANGYRFTILSLGNKTIDRVRAEKIKEDKTKGEELCQDIQNSQT